MTNPKNADDVLKQVRKLLPKTGMSYGQARIKAQQLALRLRSVLDLKDIRLSLDFVEQLPGVTVRLLSAPQMEQLTKRLGTSGATTIPSDDTYHVYINNNNSVTHCRFTLAHELFHVITGQVEDQIFADFGHGDPELHRRRAESVADHFAANLLAPSAILKREWGRGIQDVRELALCFGVSEEAMRIRLRTVGLVRSNITKRMFYRQPKSRVGAFFLRSGSHDLNADLGAPDDYREVQCDGMVLTVDEACERLRISKWTLYRLINQHQLSSFKVGRRRLVPEAAIHALIQKLSAEEIAYGPAR